MSNLLCSTDPSSGELVWEGAAASSKEVEDARERARVAFPAWAALPVEVRADFIRSFRAALHQRADAFAALISRETGKPLWESRAEVDSVAGKVDLSIAALSERAGERHTATLFGEAVLRHRPHGVMAVLGPYNFPAHLPNGHIVPALLAGNTIVFKPSELTPAVGAAIADLWDAAGLPSGVFSVLQGGRQIAAALVAGEIDGVLCTGSAATGAALRRQLVDRPNVILALELGGNNPVIAWDGDVGEVAAVVAESAFITTGQRCSCARRLVVPRTGFGDAVVEALEGLTSRLTIGAWNDRPEPFMGPLISREAADLATSQVDALVARGAKPIRPLERVEGRSAAFVTPAVLDVSVVDDRDEEIFAPVLQVVRVGSFAEALAEANHTRFGLSAALLSMDDELWRKFLHQSRAGVVNRNRPTTGASGAMPFGGLGHSGNHRPSAYYAADYCAHPVASFEAATPAGAASALVQRLGQ